jgi:hypothetical protein
MVSKKKWGVKKMDRYQSIDDKIQKGYKLLLKNDCPSCCDQWLEAWESIKELFAEEVAKDIYELDKKYDWAEFISNYVQALEMELHNAGLRNKVYHEKRAIYCQELLQWCGSDELIVSNTRRGMAEGYFESGNHDTGEQLFIEWLHDDPDWGWGYIGWSDCYLLSSGGKQYERAEEILLTGYARTELRDKLDLVDRLISLYDDMGKSDKVKEYERVFSELDDAEPEGKLYRNKPDPIKVVKIGRNESCPCGSGKKYKKCCGA